MTKIMLVEDDNNLREIYEARLMAEGYEIINARDGEEALALAVRDKPDLIISDVMMPKISGFDMLDILRSTPEIKNTKVIMMTALSQADDKERAEKLGADRYLVKSQVTLEDVAKVAAEVISDGQSAQPATYSQQPATAAPVAADQASATPLWQPTAGTQTQTTDTTQPQAIAATPPPAPVASQAPVQNNDYASQTVADNTQATPTSGDAAMITSTDSTGANPDNSQNTADNTAINGKKIIRPISDMSQNGPDLQQLLAQEELSESMSATSSSLETPPAPSVIEPGGQTVTPPNPTTQSQDTQFLS